MSHLHKLASNVGTNGSTNGSTNGGTNGGKNGVTRRWLLQLGAVGTAALTVPTRNCLTNDDHPSLTAALEQLESYLTAQQDFQDVSRGRPKPHALDQATRASVGLTRETWSLNVDSDSDYPSQIDNPMTAEIGNRLTFSDLLELGRTHAVRFPKVMTCLNIGCPLGMGIWEGVPLREVIWRAKPRSDLRRVHYHGYHNDDPRQMFRSSLPIGRILEDYFDLPPVILCYKLNGQWLSPERGGPVRVIVPEAYGFKSVKWLSHVYLSNVSHANDTYANQNNDVDSPLKSFAATLTVPDRVDADQPFAVTGYAQAGISGIAKVQVWMQPRDQPWKDDDPNFETAPWTDAELLGPPNSWGAEFADRDLPMPLHGFDSNERTPQTWPLPLTKAHWAILLPGLPADDYVLRTRTIDRSGHAQPMPRPFRKSGHAAIEEVPLRVGSS